MPPPPQYVTALVLDGAGTRGFWESVGFTVAPPPSEAPPAALRRALALSRAQPVFGDGCVWYAELLPQRQEDDARGVNGWRAVAEGQTAATRALLQPQPDLLQPLDPREEAVGQERPPNAEALAVRAGDRWPCVGDLVHVHGNAQQSAQQNSQGILAVSR